MARLARLGARVLIILTVVGRKGAGDVTSPGLRQESCSWVAGGHMVLLAAMFWWWKVGSSTHRDAPRRQTPKWTETQSCLPCRSGDRSSLRSRSFSRSPAYRVWRRCETVIREPPGITTVCKEKSSGATRSDIYKVGAAPQYFSDRPIAFHAADEILLRYWTIALVLIIENLKQ